MATADPQALWQKLVLWGQGPDDEIDLAEAALTLAALQHPGISLDRYRVHMRKLGDEVGAAYRQLVESGASESAATQIDALRDVLAHEHNYTGDNDTYDDLQNADLIRVIDRRRGMPITLAILYLHAARAQGWTAQGLNFPGHFVVRIDRGPDRLIFDPFRYCELLEAHDLRDIVKKTLGPQAELSSTYYEPATTRALLIRLQNNIKTRQIEGEDYEGALQTVEAMRVLDPGEYRLLLDAGVLYARTRKLTAAAETLENYIKQAPDERDRHDAALLLQQIRALLA